jgi:hypothetical protein
MTQPPIESDLGCAGELPPAVIEGIRLFNDGRYFEAHEELETAWKEESGPVRDLYRGILQVAVGYLHIQRGNYTGARKMFIRCRRWLVLFPDQCRGVDLGQLKHDFTIVEETLKRLGPEHIGDLDPALLKPVRFAGESPTE